MFGVFPIARAVPTLAALVVDVVDLVTASGQWATRRGGARGRHATGQPFSLVLRARVPAPEWTGRVDAWATGTRFGNPVAA